MVNDKNSCNNGFGRKTDRPKWTGSFLRENAISGRLWQKQLRTNRCACRVEMISMGDESSWNWASKGKS